MIKIFTHLPYISTSLLLTLNIPNEAIAAEKDQARELGIKGRIALFEMAATATSTEKKIIKKDSPLLPMFKTNELPGVATKETVKFPPEELSHNLLEDIFGASTRLSSIEVGYYTVALGDVAKKIEYSGLLISHKLPPESVTRYLSYLKEYPQAIAINEENMTRPTNTLGEDYDSYLVRYKLFAHPREDAQQVDKGGFIVTVSKLKEKTFAVPAAPSTRSQGEKSAPSTLLRSPQNSSEVSGKKTSKHARDLPTTLPIKSVSKKLEKELVSKERSHFQPLAAPQEISYEIIKKVLEAPFVAASIKPVGESTQSLDTVKVTTTPNLVAQKIDYQGLHISHKMTQAAPSRFLALLSQHPNAVAIKDNEHKRAVNTLGEAYDSVMVTYNLYTEAGENGKLIPHSEMIITISKKNDRF